MIYEDELKALIQKTEARVRDGIVRHGLAKHYERNEPLSEILDDSLDVILDELVIQLGEDGPSGI